MSNKKLSLFSLVMINVIAIDNLRSLPFGAEFGLSLVSYYILAAVLFFIPVALVSAECATGWPSQGGIYVWIREGLGFRWAFFTIWILWIYNVVWYPSQMIYIGATFFKWVSPEALAQPWVMFLTTSILFFICTILNRFGMQFSSWVSSTGALFGTLLPILLVILAGVYWLHMGFENHLTVSWSAVLPKEMDGHILPYLVPIVFGLVGIEMSAVHANEVDNPQKTYPRAILISTILIITSMLMASMAIAVIVPHDELNVITGIIQVFDRVLKGTSYAFVEPLIVCLVIWGAIANVATWVIGPSKGMLVAARDGQIPSWFAKTNRHGVPERILWTQFGIVVFLGALQMLLSLEVAYTLLSAMTTQLALMIYIVMFVAILFLRKHFPHQASFKVPGGKWGLTLMVLMGIISCTLIIMLGFVAPTEFEMPVGSIYTWILIIGTLFLAGFPLLWQRIGGDKHART